jgi:hypothetical protein
MDQSVCCRRTHDCLHIRQTSGSYSAINLGQTPQDLASQGADRGRSDFDRRYVFVDSIVYQIPFYKDANPVLRSVLSNWAVTSLIQLSSGNPSTVITGRGVSLLE